MEKIALPSLRQLVKGLYGRDLTEAEEKLAREKDPYTVIDQLNTSAFKAKIS